MNGVLKSLFRKFRAVGLYDFFQDYRRLYREAVAAERPVPEWAPPHPTIGDAILVVRTCIVTDLATAKMKSSIQHVFVRTGLLPDPEFDGNAYRQYTTHATALMRAEEVTVKRILLPSGICRLNAHAIDDLVFPDDVAPAALLDESIGQHDASQQEIIKLLTGQDVGPDNDELLLDEDAEQDDFTDSDTGSEAELTLHMAGGSDEEVPDDAEDNPEAAPLGVSGAMQWPRAEMSRSRDRKRSKQPSLASLWPAPTGANRRTPK